MRISFLTAALLAAGTAAAETPVLTVYTYDSFVSEWGPGPEVEAVFEESCGCDLDFVGVGDGAALLARLQLEGTRTKADVVLGLDTNLAAKADATGLFAPHGIAVPNLDLPIDWNDSIFLPYDWGYFAFIYDNQKLSEFPADFRALAESDLTMLIQDPRSSTPGLGLLLWVKAVYGDQAAEIWNGLADNIVSVTKGWSEAYGLFLKGEADAVLSYTTSPAYHIIAEGDATKSSGMFSEGHYLQIEIAGRIAGSDQPELATEFLEFMLSNAFQEIIPTTNWMYPARTPENGLPEGFDQLAMPERALIIASGEVGALRDAALEEWLNALSQ